MRADHYFLSTTVGDGGEINPSRASRLRQGPGDEGIGVVQVARAGCADHFVERLEVLGPPVDLAGQGVDGGVDFLGALLWRAGGVSHAGAQRGVEECSGDAHGVGAEREAS